MRIVIPRTANQNAYLKALQGKKSIVVATGPAGSGKTLFPCQVAAEKLKTGEIDKIILTRPNVTAGEELGHLPGDIHEKMDPWTRPMYDILEEYFSFYRLRQMIQDKTIEVCPLAYMRGRTFDRSYIMADEMQNATPQQLRMVLTRIGADSRMVISGDPEQCDLPNRVDCGLEYLVNNMEGYVGHLEYMERVILGNEDIQRHPAIEEVLNILSNNNG